MPKDTKENSKTKVSFDLRDVLTDDEVERFTSAAEAAGCSPTEHLINLTLKPNERGAA